MVLCKRRYHFLIALIVLYSSGFPFRLLVAGREAKSRDFGHRIGKFKDYGNHGIRGTVYVSDDNTILIKDFHYDGVGPAAFFFVGNSPRPSPDGVVVPYPENYVGRDVPPLERQNGTDVVLILPEGLKVKDIRWLAIWCTRFTVNFGEVFLPPDLDPPKPRILPQFKRFAHELRSGNITILDSKSFYIPNLHYDGLGPDAYFWVGNGSEPSSMGTKVPNEVGSLEPLRPYSGQDIEIQLPGNILVYDIDWLAIWCIRYRHNFGHVMIPKDLEVPPSLGQTKISISSISPDDIITQNGQQMTNCRDMLSERLRVRWGLHGSRVYIQLSAVIRPDQYIAFGISGEENRPAMVGSDIAVVYYDQVTLKFKATDYYVSATSECSGERGVCPDELIGGKNDIRLLSGERKGDITIVTYDRPLVTRELVNDKSIPIGSKVSVIAAIGPLNGKNQPGMHAVADKTTENVEIDFSTMGDDTCNADLDYWPRSVIYGENVLSARIGPASNRIGQSTAKDRSSLGILWYINKRMMPEIYVQRGQTYMFIVEGGDNPIYPMKYHPFYITDNAKGGFGQKSDEERKKQRIFAGISYDSDGNPYPTAAGKYCEWEFLTNDPSYESEVYTSGNFDSLQENCEPGESGYLNWTVEPETPNVVYYQCYMHINMGWKIFVQDPIPVKSGTIVNRATLPLFTISLTTIFTFVRCQRC